MAKRHYPKRMPGDSRAFEKVNELLEKLKVSYRRTSPYQFKIGDISYWPGTGTLHVDNETEARPERGLQALQTLIVERRVPLNAH